MTDLSDGIQATLGDAYRLERELGGGGMSRVFVAEDVALGRKVVVKVLAPELAAALNTERFRREISLAIQLQHPHIVPVLAAGTTGSLPYFVMPFVAGESLRARLDAGGAVSPHEACTILRDVAKALAFAHAGGVAHRDIKPENILLAGGSAVVTDFGIAKALSSARDGVSSEPSDGMTLTQVGTSLGTPAYMAPEQAAGDPAVDHRADIYSLGVVAYEMLAGRHPFHDRPPHGMMRAHIAETPQPIDEVAPDAPDSLAELITSCLAKDPAQRPQSAQAVLDALASSDGSGERPSARPRRARRRRLAMAGILTAGTVAVVAGLAVSRGWLNRAEPALDQRLVAVAPFRIAGADPSLHYLREGMLDLLAAKLTGQGGIQATEPRQLLDAWRRAAGSLQVDLTREEALRVAGRLRAGRLLLGDVVGTPNRIIISATLVTVPSGDEAARVSEEGAPDSLAYLVDRLAARLLTATSSEGEQRVSQLASISLPALRAYLDGQAKLRRGEVVAAAADFTRALDADSSFALAGLGLFMASSWYGDALVGARGTQIAWRERDKLSPRDRAMLVAVVGPQYPAPSSSREVLASRQEFQRLAPERAEAWYLLGDQIFHYGSALGIANPGERALEQFKRAMELDSTYVVGYIHLLPLAISLGDSATAKRAERLRLNADTSAAWHRQHAWYIAHLAGNTTAVRSIWDTVTADPQPDAFVNGVMSQSFYDGTGVSDIPRATEHLMRNAPSEQRRRQLHRIAHDLSIVRGRPTEAMRHLEQSADSANDPNLRILRIRDATLGEGDTAVAIAAARELRALEARPLPSDSQARLMQRAAVRVLEPWRLSRGDTSQTRRSLEQLRAIARRDTARASHVESQLEIAVIEALYADVAGTPLAAPLARVDSLLDQLDYASPQLHLGRLSMTTLVAARLHEKRGDVRAALRAIRRRPEWVGPSPYIATQLREEGRLSARAGDRAGAIRAYQLFLRFRATPEPSQRAQADAVRRDLARLESASR